MVFKFQKKDYLILLEALKDIFPLILGMMPFAITFGIFGVTSGLSPFSVIVMSIVVYAGLAQFMVVKLYSSGIENLFLLVGFVFLVNMRFFLMGISLLPYIRNQNRLISWILSFGLSDEPYAAVINRFSRKGYDLKYQSFTYLFVYIAWVLGTVIGVVFSKVISNPLVWGLDFAVSAAFIVMLLPRLKSAINIITAILSAFISVLFYQIGLGQSSIFFASVLVFFIAINLNKINNFYSQREERRITK